MRFIAFLSGLLIAYGAIDGNYYYVYNMAYLSLFLMVVSYFVLDFVKNNYSLSVKITIAIHKAIIILK